MIAREHRWLYPIDWRELSAFIRFDRAKGRCKYCRRPHGRDKLHLAMAAGGTRTRAAGSTGRTGGGAA